VLWLLLVATLFLVAVLLTAARHWVSTLENYRHEIELAVSRALQHEVSLGELRAGWHGIGPVLVLRDVVVAGDAGHPLAIREVRIGVDILHYLTEQEITLSVIDIIGTDLTLVRDAAGTLHPEGFSGAAALDLAALSSISRLSLLDATVTLKDLPDGAAPQRLSGVHLSLRQSGDGRALTGYATMPEGVGGRLDVEAEFPGDVARLKDLHGRVYLKAQAVVLPGGFASLLPAGSHVHGVGDVRLWVDFLSNRLTALAAEIDFRDFTLAHTAGDKGDKRFSADSMQGRFGWRRSNDGGWQFAVQELDIESGALHWKTSHLAVDAAYAQDGLYLNAAVPLLDLDSLGVLLPALPGLDNELRGRLSQLQPRGRVRDLRLSLELRDDAVSLRSVTARFSGIGCEQSGAIPHLSGLDGSISGTLEKGSLNLDAHNAGFADTHIFRGVLPVDSAAGVVSWQRTDERLELVSEALRLMNRDLAMTASFALDLPKAGSAAINLMVELEMARLDRVSYYLPARIMPPRGVAWLDRSFKDGVIHNGTVRIEGRLDQLPFDHGEGVLEVRLPVTGARLDYHPGWSAVTNLDAQVDFTGRSMDIMSHAGSIRSARLDHVHARIGDLARPDLRIQGSVHGALQVMLAELGSSPLGETYGGLVDRISTEGDADLGLDIEVPLWQHDAPVEVSGSIGLDGNKLRVLDTEIALTAINGRLVFDTKGIGGEGLKARLFDKHADVKVWTEAGAANKQNANTHIQLTGRFGLFKRFGGDSALLPKVLEGDSDWDIMLSVHGAPVRGKPANIGLQVTSSLVGTEVRLPAPLGKPRGDVQQFSVGIDRLSDHGQTLHVHYGDVLAGLLRLGAVQQGLQLQRGTLTLGGGNPELPDARTLLINGRLDRVDAAEWQPFIDTAGAGAAVPVSLDLHLGKLEMPGWRFDDVDVAMQTAGLVSEVTFGGPSLAGSVQLQQSAGRLHRVVMILDRLKLQPTGSGSLQQTRGLTPAEVPDLQVTVRNLVYGETGLGSLELLAERQAADSLAIRRLALSSGLLELRLEGGWKLEKDQQLSSIDLEVSRGDVENLLKLLGYQESIRDGRLSGRMRLAWPGPPWAFSLGRAEGKVSLKVKDGRLVDIKPGAAGRVLGLLSVSSLPRRLTLDFRDLFADGFSFDTIAGSFRIDGGNAYTNDLTVDGPAARIDISGRVGLADKDYDQLVTVTPYLKSGLPLAGALAGGPAVGAALIVAGTLLPERFDQLSKLARKQYTVTGSWAEPKVTRLDNAEPAAEDDAYDILE